MAIFRIWRNFFAAVNWWNLKSRRIFSQFFWCFSNRETYSFSSLETAAAFYRPILKFLSPFAERASFGYFSPSYIDSCSNLIAIRDFLMNYLSIIHCSSLIITYQLTKIIHPIKMIFEISLFFDTFLNQIKLLTMKMSMILKDI